MDIELYENLLINNLGKLIPSLIKDQNSLVELGETFPFNIFYIENDILHKESNGIYHQIYVDDKPKFYVISEELENKVHIKEIMNSPIPKVIYDKILWIDEQYKISPQIELLYEPIINMYIFSLNFENKDTLYLEIKKYKNDLLNYDDIVNLIKNI